jgi:phage terminase large subunit GpA-like protein
MGVYRDAFLSAFKPKPRLTGSQWAEQYRYIAPPAPEVGPWRNKRAPYLCDILDVLTDYKTQHIVCMMSSQVGKTEILLNAAGYYMHQDPTSIMLVQPTLDNAEAFSKERFDPTIKYTKVLSNLIEEQEEIVEKRKKKTSTVMMKYFVGGFAVLVGANSPASLASRPIRFLGMDEIDRYPRSLKGEGDPIKLATQRTTNYHNKKILKISTPTTKGESRIEESFELSDKRYFYVPCPHCEEMQTLEWEMVKWEKHGTELERSKTASLHCKYCGDVMRGSGRPDMDWIGKGEWRKTAESEIAGFFINSLYSAWVSLSDLVKEFLDAKHSKDQEAIQTFENLKLGLPYEDKRQSVDYETIEQKRRTTYNAVLHDNILCLTAAVDVQDTWLEAEIRGWSHGDETFGVEHKIFAGDPAQPKVWQELDEWLLTPRLFKDGYSIIPTVTCIDSGGHYTNEVYDFCKARESRNVWAIKGASTSDKPLISQPSKVGKLKDTYLWLIGTQSGKARVMSALKNESHGPLYCHFPREAGRGYDEEYFKGLMSEKYVFNPNKKTSEWKKVYERNEPLDLFVYNFAAKEILKPPYDELQKRKDEGKQAYSTNMVKEPVKRSRVLSRGIQY